VCGSNKKKTAILDINILMILKRMGAKFVKKLLKNFYNMNSILLEISFWKEPKKTIRPNEK